MKFALTVLALVAAVSAASVKAREEEEETLKECCYLYGQGDNAQLFRSSKLTSSVLGEPDKWCIAEITRDAGDPDNCASFTGGLTGGFCDLAESLRVTECTPAE